MTLDQEGSRPGRGRSRRPKGANVWPFLVFFLLASAFAAGFLPGRRVVSRIEPRPVRSIDDFVMGTGGGRPVGEVLAERLGERWKDVEGELAPSDLAVLERMNLDRLVSWNDVELEVLAAGVDWIEKKRRAWPDTRFDRWYFMNRLDFASPAFNPRGKEIREDERLELRNLIGDYNERILDQARVFWRAATEAYSRIVREGDYVPLPDPCGALVRSGLLSCDDEPGTNGALLVIPARARGWIAEVTLTPENAPELASALATLRSLEALREGSVQVVIAGL